MAQVKPRPLVAGNWKMNGSRGSTALLQAVAAGMPPDLAADLLVCPPATLVLTMAEAARGTSVAVGGQDCHGQTSGAHTGDISAEMLADAGATFVIVGHSERRADHAETDQVVREKAAAAHRAGLTAIICVGETRDERESGRALDVVAGQLRGSVPPGATAANTVVAYEPVWAIGTGLVPTAGDVGEMHAMIRRELAGQVGQGEAAQTRILYGGSVKPSNARELLAVAHVDGALVGGASLKAEDFLGIAAAYR
ncbi:triose-phosphate isomerase [Enterovirga sp.]|uniref:triose-phosphate isomerase n=1 Tax=Enterovirga sp. TaxID=2026350 RepID=UPI00260C010F|nr:triose-phosphate isomerase [Enterovirga sp.]MDB5590497.1 triosephosphate isomerase [Enterovirga sp.]